MIVGLEELMDKAVLGFIIFCIVYTARHLFERVVKGITEELKCTIEHQLYYSNSRVLDKLDKIEKIIIEKEEINYGRTKRK
jgi:hypothetical protein